MKQCELQHVTSSEAENTLSTPYRLRYVMSHPTEEASRLYEHYLVRSKIQLQTETGESVSNPLGSKAQRAVRFSRWFLSLRERTPVSDKSGGKKHALCTNCRKITPHVRKKIYRLYCILFINSGSWSAVRTVKLVFSKGFFWHSILYEFCSQGSLNHIKMMTTTRPENC
jgi:hypothetical protein